LYSNISPFEETAVILGENQNIGKMKMEEYMNANYIKTSFQEEDPNDPGNPFGFMIASQAPQDFDFQHFWEMVVQKNVTTIVALCNNFGGEDEFRNRDERKARCGP